MFRLIIAKMDNVNFPFKWHLEKFTKRQEKKGCIQIEGSLRTENASLSRIFPNPVFPQKNGLLCNNE